MRISYLTEHPEFIPTLARGLLEQYGHILPSTIETRIAKLQTHMNRDVLPIAWVAHSGMEVFGTAALRVHDLEGREDLTPWLGGVYVLPEFRRRGIGTALCATVEQKAAVLGTRALYLFTLDRQSWYRSLGWSRFESCTWCGRRGDIMIKSLDASKEELHRDALQRTLPDDIIE
jgi:N-acetylglutamate synthase-like GNAT family acetyltransferase